MQILSKYNENFQKALSRLNENQLKAVNHIDGPVLVIAGPGTGKTQILAARIGKISAFVGVVTNKTTSRCNELPN